MALQESAPHFQFDQGLLDSRLSVLLPRYRSSDPWPHVVIDGLLPSDLLDVVRDECGRLPEESEHRSNTIRQVKQERSCNLGPSTQLVLSELQGPVFRKFLSELTGIDGLLPDPSNWMAGVHTTPRGGFTLVHRDFRRHHVTGLYHRVNVLLYLNRGWQENFGGALELWPPSMSEARQCIQPNFNTMVIFETHDQTLHGLPEVVNCPEGQSRLSLATYFYTEDPPQRPVKVRHAVFGRRPQDPWIIGITPPKEWLREYTPPIVKTTIRRLLSRYAC